MTGWGWEWLWWVCNYVLVRTKSPLSSREMRLCVGAPHADRDGTTRYSAETFFLGDKYDVFPLKCSAKARSQGELFVPLSQGPPGLSSEYDVI